MQLRDAPNFQGLPDLNDSQVLFPVTAIRYAQLELVTEKPLMGKL